MSTILQRAAAEAIKKHGGTKAAAAALGLDPSTLWRFAKGDQKRASVKACRALGLEAVTIYKRVRPATTAPPSQ